MKQTKQEWIDQKDYLPDCLLVNNLKEHYFDSVVHDFNKTYNNSFGFNVRNFTSEQLYSFVMKFFLPTMADYGYTPKRRKVNMSDKENMYTPLFMRDFHDCKEVFKTICSISSPIGSKESQESLSWNEAHCFIIDFFLRDLAYNGYMLQKSNKNLDFKDINKDVELYKRTISNNFSAMINRNNKT